MRPRTTVDESRERPPRPVDSSRRSGRRRRRRHVDRSGARMKELSKLMSLILRHEPERFGLVLDAEGFVLLDELLAAVRTRFPSATRDQLLAVVERVEP